MDVKELKELSNERLVDRLAGVAARAALAARVSDAMTDAAGAELQALKAELLRRLEEQTEKAAVAELQPQPA